MGSSSWNGRTEATGAAGHLTIYSTQQDTASVTAEDGSPALKLLSTGQIITGLLAIPDGLLIASPGLNGPFGFVSPAFVGVLLLSIFAIIFLSLRHSSARQVAVWNNGVAKIEEPNSFTYANTLRLTMKRVYPAGNSSSREDFTSSYDVFWIWLIVLAKHFELASRRFSLWFMNSDLSRYMLYLLLAFFAVLLYIIV